MRALPAAARASFGLSRRHAPLTCSSCDVGRLRIAVPSGRPPRARARDASLYHHHHHYPPQMDRPSYLDPRRLRLEGLDEYELERSSVCAAFGEKSANNEARLETNVRNLADAHALTRERVFTMQRCYDTSLIDADLPLKPDGVTRFDPLQQVIFDASCDVDLAVSVDSLEDGVFDCLQLEECEIFFNDLADNSGRDQTLLFDYSRRAMCTAQWWFHSTVLSAVFSVVIWLFVNIFRFLLVAGLVRICWQWLNTGYFTYLATCESDGAHTYKKADLADRVDALLGRIRTYGAGMVLLAFGTQIPWIVLLMRFMNGLQFVSD